ncbi:MAG: phage major capsid protein [Clostridiales bacterium]|nr:phage major capsid protein [Clostridiales bacterium]
MVTLTSAESALKTVYLGVVANQLNINSNPLLGKIKQSTKDVWGKEVRKLAPYGINGGIGAGAETDALPKAAGNNYVQFVSELKNLYGKIELSDKAIRASESNAGAFVNLLNDEMEGLIKASSFNFGRMLYGDGSGLLATVKSFDSQTKAIECDSVKNLIEGMVIDGYTNNTKQETKSGLRIKYVDRLNNKFYVETTAEFAEGDQIYVQNSKDFEITGLGKIFSNSETLYGLTRADYPWLAPFIKTEAGEISDGLIQSAIDFLDEVSGSTINYIACSSAVRRAYQEYLSAYRRNIDIAILDGGYKAISYNGIPLVADRFVADDTMYLLNTEHFTLHQLCDWKWLEGEDGRVIRQNIGFPTYSATLVKYADLICDKPNGQAKISGISSMVTNPFTTVVNA